MLVPFTIGAGQTADYYYEYSITLMDDGLQAERTQPFCVSLIVPNCGPAPTGFELAYAIVVAGYRDGRALNQHVGVSEDSVTLQTSGDSFADTLTKSGVLHVHIDGYPVLPERDSFLVYAFAVVDASPLSPIPEPSIFAIFCGGFAFMGLMSRSAVRSSRRELTAPCR